MENEKTLWAIYTNSDLTEGRGRQYAALFTPSESHAKRLAKGNGVQGSDAMVLPVICRKINNTWYYPDVLERTPSEEDLEADKLMVKQSEAAARKEAIIEKAKSLGLTDEDISYLQ